MKPTPRYEAAVVFVVDDDVSVREAIDSLLRSVGLHVKTFSSPREFLDENPPDIPACLVLDVRLPGKSGLDLQRHLLNTSRALPIIFITGHGDIQMSVQAMKGGAIEFLTKPFSDDDLLNAIWRGLAQDRDALVSRAEISKLQGRYESLTPREQEVMDLVVQGRLNKQVAAELGTAEITVKVHRRSVMDKMKVSSIVDLVRIAEKLRSARKPPTPSSNRSFRADK